MNPCATPWQRKWLDLEITDPAVQDVAHAAEDFCRRWFNNEKQGSLLVLVGDTGTCKTHVASKLFKFCRAAAMKAFDSGKHGQDSVPSVAFLRWPSTVSTMVDRDLSNKIVEDAAGVSLRIIDDIGAENNPWGSATDSLCQILSRSEGKHTVVTTNIEPKDWSTKFDIRIADRLLRNSVVKSLRGVKSYAIWKRTQGANAALTR